MGLFVSHALYEFWFRLWLSTAAATQTTKLASWLVTRKDVLEHGSVVSAVGTLVLQPYTHGCEHHSCDSSA